MLVGDAASEAVRRLLSEFDGTFGEWIATRGVEADFRCEYCGEDLLASLGAYYSIQIDHVLPVSHDGPHCFENMALSCKPCNLLKRDFVPSGSNREERVADARRHLLVHRRARKSRLAEVREVVGRDTKA